MSERAGVVGSAPTGAGEAGRLGELSAIAADLRRELASGVLPGQGRLGAGLAAVAEGLSRREVDAAEAAPLLALLDELDGLAGQLEFECEAIRSRILALDRHRRARATYLGSCRRG